MKKPKHNKRTTKLKPRNFCQIYFALLHHPGLPRETRYLDTIVYGTLYYSSDKCQHKADITQQEIAKALGSHISTVKRSIKRLADLKLIKIKQRGKKLSNQYTCKPMGNIIAEMKKAGHLSSF